ncbi:hypothetical protein ACFWAA_24630 [Streptomyces sp. NPDC059922]|uniref:hypothetical protein n=1 Tax=Streptomyces sp. NPDC059922 TaxID=3347005 RepID=UPI003668C47D
MPEPEADWLDEVERIAGGAIARFPRHNDIFHLVSRLAEETGEVPQRVNHLEGMGVKRERHGNRTSATSPERYWTWCAVP